MSTVRQYVIGQLRKTGRELSQLGQPQSQELALQATRLRLQAVREYMRIHGIPTEPEIPEPPPEKTETQKWLDSLDERDRLAREASNG